MAKNLEGQAAKHELPPQEEKEAMVQKLVAHMQKLSDEMHKQGYDFELSRVDNDFVLTTPKQPGHEIHFTIMARFPGGLEENIRKTIIDIGK